MPEEIQDTEESALESEGEETQEELPPEDSGQEQEEEAEGFNEKQLQQMYSATGRIISKQFEEKIVPMMQEMTPKTPVEQPQTVTDDFNKSLQDMIFSGDVIGAFDRYNTAKEQQETNLTQQQETETNKAITSHSEDPYYKEIYDDVKTKASDLVKNGYPPIPAAATAMAVVKASYLETKLTGDTGNLAMSGGGKRTVTTKGTKLPPEYKAVCAKGIQDGLWANEKEYIADLSPRVKTNLGIV